MAPGARPTITVQGAVTDWTVATRQPLVVQDRRLGRTTK